MLGKRAPFFRDSRVVILSGVLWLIAVVNLVAQPEWRPLSGPARAAPGTGDGVDVAQRRGSPKGDSRNFPREPMWRVKSRYDAMIASVAGAHGLDAALLKAMVQAESAFDPNALSVDGAQGLMQLLPETAAQVGVVDLLNPYLNLQAGARHLKRLLRKFDGDLLLAVAAYNAGEYAVKRHGGVPPYRETHRYLYRVFGLQSIYAGNVSAPGRGGRGEGARRIVVVSLQ